MLEPRADDTVLGPVEDSEPFEGTAHAVEEGERAARITRQDDDLELCQIAKEVLGGARRCGVVWCGVVWCGVM